MRPVNPVPKLIGTTKLSRWMIHCSAQRNDCKWAQAAEMCQPVVERVHKSVTLAVEIGVAAVLLLPALGFFSWGWHSLNDVNKKIVKNFEKPDLPSLIREKPHYPRKEEEEIRKAFLNSTNAADTLGLVGVVFGPAGTGKSNVVRTVCKQEKERRDLHGKRIASSLSFGQSMHAEFP